MYSYLKWSKHHSHININVYHGKLVDQILLSTIAPTLIVLPHGFVRCLAYVKFIVGKFDACIELSHLMSQASYRNIDTLGHISCQFRITIIDVVYQCAWGHRGESFTSPIQNSIMFRRRWNRKLLKVEQSYLGCELKCKQSCWRPETKWQNILRYIIIYDTSPTFQRVTVIKRYNEQNYICPLEDWMSSIIGFVIKQNWSGRNCIAYNFNGPKCHDTSKLMYFSCTFYSIYPLPRPMRLTKQNMHQYAVMGQALLYMIDGSKCQGTLQPCNYGKSQRCNISTCSQCYYLFGWFVDTRDSRTSAWQTATRYDCMNIHPL